MEVGRNLTHASDSVENAIAEINLWFKPEEIVQWNQSNGDWIFGNN
ncbi:MAG: nucleoside-diphosphate kinase [Chloroflexota bacterium]